MESIEALLDRASEAYYKGEQQILSDQEFDYLAELIGYNKVGATIGNMPHYSRMYSLRKYVQGDSLPELEDPIITPKLDGSAVSLLYVSSGNSTVQLSTALTRGNGLLGENITDKLSTLVPLQLRCSASILFITGEVVTDIGEHSKNSRNYVSGALHLKNMDEFKTRRLSFVAYGVVYAGWEKSTYLEDMDFLDKLGFSTVVTVDHSNILKDGKVFRENSNRLYVSRGFTDRYPRAAYAVKNTEDFEVKETTLREVKWQVGKNGTITPVGYFDEIVLDGAKVSKATLHNIGFIEEMGIELNCTILVTRSGGIIPKVLAVSENF